MNLQLPPHISVRVQAYLGSGGYENEEDVLRTVLDALEERDEDKLRRWHEGNRIAMEQSRQGLSKPLDLEALLERVEQQVSAKERGL
jgi:Arc/MetJ-type ribon-helix-helix transcriptional regulator